MRKQIKKGDKVVLGTARYAESPMIHVVEQVLHGEPDQTPVLKLEGINGFVSSAAYVRVPVPSKKDRQIAELSKMLNETKAVAKAATNDAHDQRRKQVALQHQMDSQLLQAGLVRTDFLREHAVGTSAFGDATGTRYAVEFITKPGSTLMARVVTAIKEGQ